VFILNADASEKKLRKIKQYLLDLVEGYVIVVNNFDIVEQAFHNISLVGTKKNILESNFDNNRYII
jgi:hypothetical protein